MMAYMQIMLLLSTLLIGVAFTLSPGQPKCAEMGSPFECGFDPKGSGRVSFSLRFYLIALIFLIFDAEITYLLPLIPAWGHGSLHLYVGGLVFMLTLLLGTFYESKEGALDWKEYLL